MNLIDERLKSHHLIAAPFAEIKDVVQHYGAVQAQDYNGAAWALSLRLENVSRADIDEAFNTGKILRTHVLRPTWHFVLPEDIRWMVELSSPRIKQAMAHYNRKLELDDKFFARSHRIITDVLAGGAFLTRAELAQALAQKGIEASGQRLAHIVMQTEIDGLICSGPLRGKQFTYSLLAKRASNAKNLSREMSLDLLATRYFQSHGPATLKDFIWWSGLSSEDGKLALELCKNKFLTESVDGKEYFFSAHQIIEPSGQSRSSLQLLSVYDEYVIAYANYDPIFIDKTKSLSNIFGNARLDYVVVFEGKIVGTWRRRVSPKIMTIVVHLEIELSPRLKKLIMDAVERYSHFLGIPAELAIG